MAFKLMHVRCCFHCAYFMYVDELFVVPSKVFVKGQSVPIVKQKKIAVSEAVSLFHFSFE